MEIHKKIKLNSSYSDVLAAYWEFSKSTALTIRNDNPKTWEIMTPLEFGAENWVLWIEFEDEKVRALKIRTLDGPPQKMAQKTKKATE